MEGIFKERVLAVYSSEYPSIGSDGHRKLISAPIGFVEHVMPGRDLTIESVSQALSDIHERSGQRIWREGEKMKHRGKLFGRIDSDAVNVAAPLDLSDFVLVMEEIHVHSHHVGDPHEADGSLGRRNDVVPDKTRERPGDFQKHAVAGTVIMSAWFGMIEMSIKNELFFRL